ncbi:hypothetical protein ACFTAO_41600 [Paenibacillus rhizoplanae]
MEEPLLYIEQLRIIGGGQLVQVKSNIDIDQKSLEQALKKIVYRPVIPRPNSVTRWNGSLRALSKSACIWMRTASGPGHSTWMKPLL